MSRIHRTSPGWLAIVGCLLLVAVDTASAGSPVLRQDRAWKVYLNRQLGYCVSYPSRWYRSETFDGAGLAVATSAGKKSFIPVGSIDVSALPAKAPELISASLSLSDDLDVQIEGLRRFARAQQMEILEKRDILLESQPSLFVKIRYLDPRDRKFWVEEVIFTHRNGKIYRLEMEARADQLERFDSIFTRFVSSFQIECGGKTEPAQSSEISSFRLPQ